MKTDLDKQRFVNDMLRRENLELKTEIAKLRLEILGLEKKSTSLSSFPQFKNICTKPLKAVANSGK